MQLDFKTIFKKMKNNSSRKHIDKERSKYVESRLLISHHNINPLSNQISSKLDLIKKQISREFHQKFPTEKKRNSSTKKRAMSTKLKSESMKSVSRKLQFPDKIEPNLCAEEIIYREKYFALNEKYLDEKKKVLENQERYFNLKECTANFIEDLSKKSMDELTAYLESQRNKSNLEKILSLNEDIAFAQNTLNEIMTILQVQDIESLMNQLQKFPAKYKNYDQFSFRIIELETNCNRTVEEYKKRMQQVETLHDEKQKNLIDKIESVQKQLRYEKQQTLNDINNQILNLVKQWGKFEEVFSQPEVISSPNALLKKVSEIMEDMRSNLQIIEKQARQNKQNFINTKEDFSRMELIMEELKREKTQELTKINEQCENLYQELQAEKNSSTQRIIQLTAELSSLSQMNKKQVSEVQQFREKAHCFQSLKKRRDKQFELFLEKISSTLGCQFKMIINQQNCFEVVSKSVISYLQQMKEKVNRSESFVQWHEKQLGLKEALLKEFDFNLKKMMEESIESEKKVKQACLEKEEYKYLLTNLREQLIQVKTQHDEKIKKTIADKDSEYLTINKDILESNKKFLGQIQVLKRQLKMQEEETKTEKASHLFFQKKTEHEESLINDLRKKLIFSENQAKKYKHHLSEIETSLKQVESNMEKNTIIIQNLEEEKKKLSFESEKLYLKNEELEKQSVIQDQQLKKYFNINDEYQRKVLHLEQYKQNIQFTNSQLRIENLQKQQEIRKREDAIQEQKRQNTLLMKQNHKLSREINDLTRKLLIKTEKKNQSCFLEKLKILQRSVKSIKKQLFVARKFILQTITKEKNYLRDQQSHILNSFENTMNSSRQKRQILSKKRQLKYSQRLKIIKVQQKVMKMREIIKYLRTELKQTKYQLQDNLQTFIHIISLIFPALNQSSQAFTHIICQLLKTKLRVSQLKNNSDSIKEDFQNFKNKFFYFWNKEFHNLENLVSENPIKFSPSSNHEYKEFFEESESPYFGKIQNSDATFSKDDNECDNAVIAEEMIEDSSEQGQKINYILRCLLENLQSPKIAKFEEIRQNYNELKKKLNSKNFNLDISGISAKPHTLVGSPTSVNFSKQFILDRRLQSEPEQQIIGRPTNRSEQKGGHFLHEQNLNLRNEVKELEQILQEKQLHYQQLKIEFNQIEKKYIALENEVSLRTLQKLFIKLFDAIFSEKVNETEDTCSVLMKMLQCSREDIEKVKDNFEKRKKKKGTSFFGGLFNK